MTTYCNITVSLRTENASTGETPWNPDSWSREKDPKYWCSPDNTTDMIALAKDFAEQYDKAFAVVLSIELCQNDEPPYKSQQIILYSTPSPRW